MAIRYVNFSVSIHGLALTEKQQVEHLQKRLRDFAEVLFHEVDNRGFICESDIDVSFDEHAGDLEDGTRYD